MQSPCPVGGDVQTLLQLLPVGTVLCHDRIIVSMNGEFARLFGYEPHQLLGESLELLYPDRREFIDRGEQWRGFLVDHGAHCDERVMMRAGDEPLQMRVRGRCGDRANPYGLVACTFEPVGAVAASSSIPLSRRERQIVDAMADGLTSKEIARVLSLSHRTVETYRQRLMARTGARNASQLLALLR